MSVTKDTSGKNEEFFNNLEMEVWAEIERELMEDALGSDLENEVLATF